MILWSPNDLHSILRGPAGFVPTSSGPPPQCFVRERERKRERIEREGGSERERDRERERGRERERQAMSEPLSVDRACHTTTSPRQIPACGPPLCPLRLLPRMQSSYFLPLEPFPPEAGPSRTRSPHLRPCEVPLYCLGRHTERDGIDRISQNVLIKWS